MYKQDHSVFFLIFFVLFLNSIDMNYGFSQNTKRIDSILIAANFHFVENNYDSAEYCYKEVLKSNPTNIEALLGLAKNEYQQIDILDILNNKNYYQAKNSEDHGTSYDRFKYSKAMDYVDEVLKVDPNNIEANYIAGILLREKMRLRFAISRGGSFSDGNKHFQKVININPKYRDTYLQYAMLFRYYDKYIESLDTCMKSIELKPELSANYLGMRRIAADFFKDGNKEDIQNYLNAETDIYKRYLLGEYERLMGSQETALSIFKTILRNYYFTPEFYVNYSHFPVTLIFSSMLKIYAKQDEPVLINKTFWQAVESIKNDVEADVLFDDLKYLASSEELTRYSKINFEEKRNKFFNGFWNKRHPETNMNFSQRLVEHYKRLIYAEKEYPQSRERVLFKDPANSYESNFEFMDQGFVYVKHGKPDKINKTSSYSIEEENPFYSFDKFKSDTGSGPSIHSFGDDSLIFNGPINEAWLYKESPFNKKMIFCFIGMSKRLTSNFFNREILKDIKNWDDMFFRYVNALNSNDEDVMLEKMVKEGKQQMFTGISSERSTLKTSTKEILLPNEIYKMKGNNGKTHLEIAYYLPFGYLLGEIPKSIDTLQIETGYMILDKDWNVDVMKTDTIAAARKDKKTLSQIKYLFVDVDPDSAEINLFFNPLNSDISCFYKNRTKIENFSGAGLKMSDILVATKIEKTSKNGFFSRNGFDIIPSPTSKYPLDKLLNIYYEVYGLKKNSEGKTLYNVEYAFRFSGSDENLLTKLFNNKEGQTISTEYSKAGKESSSNEYMSFDMSKLKEGIYDLEVTIKDVNAQRTIKKTKRIELFD